MVNLLQSGLASAERVFELLDAEEEPGLPLRAPAGLPGAPVPATPSDSGEASPSDSGEATPSESGEVVFDDVSFSYTDEPLIEDLSLSVSPGQTVAIVGPTGAG